MLAPATLHAAQDGDGVVGGTPLPPILLRIVPCLLVLVGVLLVRRRRLVINALPSAPAGR